MNREIKFRVWLIHLHEMLYEFTLPQAGSGQDINKAFKTLSNPIMQFTGLRDKNGKEIYEGDILKGGIFKSYEVKWDHENTGWNISLQAILFEVSGNIFENPELIK